MHFSLGLSQTKTCDVPKSILHSDPTGHTPSTRTVSGWLWPPALCFTGGNLSWRIFETASFVTVALKKKTFTAFWVHQAPNVAPVCVRVEICDLERVWVLYSLFPQPQQNSAPHSSTEREGDQRSSNGGRWRTPSLNGLLTAASSTPNHPIKSHS